ncbi:MAG: radical SAM protein [Clostridiales bacterium]|nr:radical SAM protein [Clostridiales bacterium]
MKCSLCPVSCNADREKSAGRCGVGGIKIAKYYLHPFEEPVISFKNGSGCVFFCGCSLRCVFCQNFELSRNERGKEITASELAGIFKELEERGADNINLVTPTHYVDKIAEAFSIYRPKIPVVYNTHGYEKLSTLKIADTFTDIYLPDLKFIDGFLAERYTGRADYADFALPAVEFMSKKPKKLSGDGKLLSGCIVRHLILPLASYDSVKVAEFVAELPEDTYFSLMRQYTPFGEAEKFPELERKVTDREYDKVLSRVRKLGLKNVFLQDKDSAETAFIPKWDF